MLKRRAAMAISEGNRRFDEPRLKLGGMRNLACVVLPKTLGEILGQADIKAAAVGGLEDIDVVEVHAGLPSRSSERSNDLGPPPQRGALLRRGSLRFVAALRAKAGGAEGSRTPDLLIANETLYQLSYDPAHQTSGLKYGGSERQGKRKSRRVRSEK